LDEREQTISRVCEEAVRRLAIALPDREVAFLIRRGDALIHLAHEGRLRLIYEVPRELGGVTWRAVESGTVQVVPDVAADPDYVASDDSIRSEIAVPVRAGGAIVGALDVESTSAIEADDAEIVAREGERLGRELDAIYSPS
jgi:putative methionine-R-sulfoxide reductase with GAF domain